MAMIAKRAKRRIDRLFGYHNPLGGKVSLVVGIKLKNGRSFGVALPSVTIVAKALGGALQDW